VTSIRFTTDDRVSLEGELRLPVGDPVAGAAVCHAHPRHGGSKDHPVLWAVRAELASRGFAVLAFDFRGVMRSGGAYGGGRAELRDVAEAVGRVQEEAGGPVLACGWCFGANVALREAVGRARGAARHRPLPLASRARGGRRGRRVRAAGARGLAQPSSSER
jgi:alpha/beta superfamily hydrolase